MVASSYLMAYSLCAAIATEISTPFGHLRWLLLKARMTHTMYFHLMNVTFLFVFCVIRLIVIEWYIVIPYVFECLSPKATVGMPLSQRLGLLFIALAWCALQYAWGAPFIVAQAKRYKANKAKSVDTTTADKAAVKTTVKLD
eukprot:Selendium_serpulae@DN4639_c0_g1_i1.p2